MNFSMNPPNQFVENPTHSYSPLFNTFLHIADIIVFFKSFVPQYKSLQWIIYSVDNIILTLC